MVVGVRIEICFGAGIKLGVWFEVGVLWMELGLGVGVGVVNKVGVWVGVGLRMGLEFRVGWRL